MPSPSSALSTQRPDLADSFYEFDYAMNQNGFIATEVYPILDVARQAGNFGKIPVEQLLKRRDLLRAPGAGYNRHEWTFLPDTYSTKEYGTEEPIDDREAEMYADYFDAEVVSTGRAFNAVLAGAEKRIADAVFSTTTFTGAALTTAVSTPWATHATATPIIDVKNAMEKVYSNSGLWPNALIINVLEFNNLIHCAQVVDRVKYQGFMDARPGAISRQALATALNIDRILVAGATEDTAGEGLTASLGPIWASDKAMIAKIAMSQDVREPCLGRTFHWSADGSQARGQVETYRDESVRSTIVRVRHDVDEKMLYVECGHLLTSV